ncbi:multi-sensor signal transduction histidine kinase [Natrinema pellirubrum DSM 15624]|uniref:histidine kinase n=1 Tax=Natrinema pellirubrum (strain DSM 15624 / CIP 106293 / JCM 10476 / NCIMB 786 / 157) TaxID=797303 RepID=L0JJC6_NATP1|nr:PAS domain S-box protein [Natrinema pellirubrum]AGB30441.1 PAS domain S-box [Natrinema pellirubrum DSM 15624]ELY79753.1 multi-sensor signal transduction histidine kinase [Natrinema pellirubrum DSM 15624]
MSRAGQHVVFVGNPTPPCDLDAAFDVVTAGDRATVVDCLETTRVDCVIVDGTGSDRVETVATVRDVAPTVPIIYTTATPDGSAAAAATRAGATEYVVRTGDPSLIDRIEALSTGGGDSPIRPATVDAATESPASADVGTDLTARTETADGQAPPVGPAERDAILGRFDDAVIVVDSDRRFVHVNDAFADLVGADREGLVGRSAASIIDEAAYRDWMAAVGSPTPGETVETELRRVDGGVVHVEANVTPLSAAGPEDIAFVCVVRDVTERRRRTDVVTGLLETTRSLFACESRADVSEVVVEAAERVLGFDLATVRLHDAETDDLVLTAVSEASGDGIRKRTRVGLGEGPMGEAFRRGEPVLIEDLRTNSPHEYERLQAGMCVPLGDHGLLNVGSPVVDAFDDQHVQLARLLTASAAAALERAERGEELLRHEQILETVEGMVYAIDGDARLTLVTDPLAERLGYDRDELVGEPVSRIFADESYDRAVDHIEDLLSDADCDSGAFEATYTTADGDRFPVEIECSLLPHDGDDDEFHGTVSVVRDITKRKEREQYLQVLNRVLRHNLRNDLTVVIGYAELLRERLDDPDLVAAADTLRETAADLAGTSEKTRAIQYALDRDGDLEPIDVAATVTETVEGLDTDGATVSVSAADDPSAWADPGLGLVVENLVENAIRHGGPEPTVDIAVAREDCRVRLAVADDGPGIPPAEIDVVTGESDITQLTHSSGLGLWLVRWMVDSYGGSVSFSESALGGSRVEIALEPAPSADGD